MESFVHFCIHRDSFRVLIIVKYINTNSQLKTDDSPDCCCLLNDSIRSFFKYNW